MVKKTAIIELGSNAIRLAEFLIEDQSFTEISLNRIAQRLLNPDKHIEDVTISKVIKIVENFKNEIDSDAEIYAIATAALRTANNQAEFIDAIYQNIGINIEIIPAEKEAYYDYLAVDYKLGLKDILIADIGGGSTEVITVNNGELTNAVSIGWGGVSLTNKFFTKIPVNNIEQETATKFMQNELGKLKWLRKFNKPMVLLGGASIVLFKTLEETEFVDSKKVQDKIEKLRALDINQLQKLKVIPDGTVDVINGGMTIMDEIIDFAQPSEIATIKASIREGYLLEKIKRAR